MIEPATAPESALAAEARLEKVGGYGLCAFVKCRTAAA